VPNQGGHLDQSMTNVGIGGSVDASPFSGMDISNAVMSG
jgi:hypothetical protein